MCVVATSSGFTSDAKRAAKETKNIEVRLLPAEDVALNLSEEQIPNPT